MLKCDMACDTGHLPMNQKVPNIGSVLSLTVLWECPAFGHARGALCSAYRRPTREQLFGTDKGLTSLADFLHRTRAFKKKSLARWPAADVHGG
jgi:hypothetical protein